MDDARKVLAAQPTWRAATDAAAGQWPTPADAVGRPDWMERLQQALDFPNSLELFVCGIACARGRAEHLRDRRDQGKPRRHVGSPSATRPAAVIFAKANAAGTLTPRSCGRSCSPCRGLTHRRIRAVRARDGRGACSTRRWRRDGRRDPIIDDVAQAADPRRGARACHRRGLATFTDDEFSRRSRPTSAWIRRGLHDYSGVSSVRRGLAGRCNPFLLSPRRACGGSCGRQVIDLREVDAGVSPVMAVTILMIAGDLQSNNSPAIPSVQPWSIWASAAGAVGPGRDRPPGPLLAGVVAAVTPARSAEWSSVGLKSPAAIG